MKHIKPNHLIAYLLIIVIGFMAVAIAALQPIGEYIFDKKSEQCFNTGLQFVDSAEKVIAQDTDEKVSFCADLALKCDIILYNETEIEEISNKKIREAVEGNVSRSFINVDYSFNAESVNKAECVCVYILDSGVMVCTFEVQDALEDFIGIIRTFSLPLGVIFVLIAGFMIIGVYRYMRPMRRLKAAIGKLSNGDFTVRVKEDGNNEFTQLISAFNEMTCSMETLDRSRNQFVSNASHELKTPMTTVKLLIEGILYQDPIDNAMAHDFLSDADKEIDRMTAVVGDLLTLVKMDSGASKLKLEDINLQDLLQEDVRRLSPIARERGIDLTLNVKEELSLSGDKSKLDQVFYNLIDNAIKYTGRAGEVSIEAFKQNRNAIIRVKDTGVGIPQEDIQHIFDRFYRVDKARSRDTGGTGLGLSIVKQIILAHNGTINVTSQENKGTTFTVQLPINSLISGTKAE